MKSSLKISIQGEKTHKEINLHLCCFFVANLSLMFFGVCTASHFKIEGPAKFCFHCMHDKSHQRIFFKISERPVGVLNFFNVFRSNVNVVVLRQNAKII